MIKGKQFFAHEIVPVLEAANGYACRRFISGLDYDEPPADQAVWRKTCGDLTALLVEANQRFATDETATGLSPVYNETSMWWQQVAFALSPFADVPEIQAAVAQLPADFSPLPGPTWMFPLAIGMGALAVIGAGYWWVKR